MRLPRHVWVVEVSKVPLWNVPPADKRVIGEIVLDPTSNPRQFGTIAVHIEERLWLTDPREQSMSGVMGDPVVLSDWTPNKCVSRKCT